MCVGDGTLLYVRRSDCSLLYSLSAAFRGPVSIQYRLFSHRALLTLVKLFIRDFLRLSKCHFVELFGDLFGGWSVSLFVTIVIHIINNSLERVFICVLGRTCISSMNKT